MRLPTVRKKHIVLFLLLSFLCSGPFVFWGTDESGKTVQTDATQVAQESILQEGDGLAGYIGYQWSNNEWYITWPLALVAILIFAPPPLRLLWSLIGSSRERNISTEVARFLPYAALLSTAFTAHLWLSGNVIRAYAAKVIPSISFLEGPWGTYGVWTLVGIIAFGVVWLVLSLMMPRVNNPLSAEARVRILAGATDIGEVEARRLVTRMRRPRRLALSLGAILLGLTVLWGVAYLIAPNNTLALIFTVGPMVLGYLIAWILFDLSQWAKRLEGYGYIPCRLFIVVSIVVALYTTVYLVPWGAIG